MPLTPESLPRHELVGLDAEIVSADNEDLVGIAGEVVTETTKTLGIQRDDRVSHVPKAGTTFEFAIPSGGGHQVVTVDGDRLVARPARRTEQTGDSKWR
ncbi:ribonuclease P protein component 1 [Salinibaculum salinum]|uniref:ribonuclease P protein component 1 n=1 Tax=Salinibaculum salinum TaxID=3131996 RepID=UPI0030EC491C